jgi:MYXO-CTERM domain-containing protein
MQVSFSANPGDAIAWLKASTVKIPPGQSANIPLTLAVPKDAASGESYVILTAGRTSFDVRFSVGVPAPRQCLAAGYKPPSAGHSTALLWLLLLLVIVVAALWIRRRLALRG